MSPVFIVKMFSSHVFIVLISVFLSFAFFIAFLLNLHPYLPQTPIGALPLDPAGRLSSPTPLFVSLNKFMATQLRFAVKKIVPFGFSRIFISIL